MAQSIVGLSLDDAKARVLARAEESRVAGTALVTALEMVTQRRLLETNGSVRLPLLTAFGSETPDAIAEEVEARLVDGFRTFKIKVGKDVDADIARVREIQRAVNGRATLRIDANRAYSRTDGCRFAVNLDASGVELFEQPCDADDWDANAAVAAVSTVPLILDEPICSFADVDRAATIPGVGLCKVKLKRFGSLEALAAVIRHIKKCGLQAVLGDGLGAELNCWMEARVAYGLIDNAGEFNGYLKIRPEDRLLKTPLPFDAGTLTLSPGWWPEMDLDRLKAHCLAQVRFAVGDAAPRQAR